MLACAKLPDFRKAYYEEVWPEEFDEFGEQSEHSDNFSNHDLIQVILIRCLSEPILIYA